MRDTHCSIISVIARRPARTITCAALAVAFAVTPVLSPVSAYAVSAETQAELDSAVSKVEKSAAAYDEAVAKLDDLQAEIDENAAEIERLEQEIPVQQAAASSAMRDMYKYRQGSNPLVSIMVGSESMSDFITTCAYMDQINASNTEAIEELNSLQAELEERKTELDAQKKELEEEKEAAADALAEAQALRAEAQAQAEAEAAAELAAAAKAKDTAPAKGEGADADNPYSTATESNQQAETVVASGAVNWNMSKEDFVNEWAGRIDAYLAGSPLAGYGRSFAEAAWTYGVDPRWSPAISCIESSKGRYCANTNNAWGWTAVGGGFRAFSSWDEGINMHVSYLRNMYGTTLTPSAAQTYCPPTWQDWYNKVGGEMNRI